MRKRLPQLLLAVLPLLAGLLLAAACTSEQGLSIERADRLIRERRYSEAARCLSRAYEAAPESRRAPEALFRLAELQYLHLKNPDEAALTYERVLQRYPASPVARRAQIRLADISFYDKAKYPEALEGYQKVIDAFPGGEGLEEVRFKVALCYFRMGAYRQAALEFERLAADYPGQPVAERARLEQGLCLFHAGEEEASAKVLLELATALGSRKDESGLAARAFFEAAQARESQGRLAEALDLYERSAEGHPSPALVEKKIESVRRRMEEKGIEEPEKGGE